MFLPSFFSSNPLSSPGALRSFLHQSLHIPVTATDADSAIQIGILETFLLELRGRDALEIQTISASINGIVEEHLADGKTPEDFHAAVSLDQFDKLVSLRMAWRGPLTNNPNSTYPYPPGAREKAWAEDSELMRVCLMRNGLYLQADPRTGAALYCSADRGSDLSKVFHLSFEDQELRGFWLENRKPKQKPKRARRA